MGDIVNTTRRVLENFCYSLGVAIAVSKATIEPIALSNSSQVSKVRVITITNSS
jgi:hypothetical protein